MKVPISKRLLCCASMVKPGSRVADVGCDHGYLGIHLLREGIASFVYAMDLRREPLQRARDNAARFGTGDRMRFFTCDGLSALEAGLVDTVACAGLGGDAIAKLMEACPWSADPAVTWLLQPQSSGNDLRRWLGEHAFSIRRELLVRDGGFLYAAMEVQSGGGRHLTPGEQYLSPRLLDCEPELVRAYFERVIRGVQRAVDGIARARTPEDPRRLAYYETALGELLEMREAYEHRQGNPNGAL